MEASEKFAAARTAFSNRTLSSRAPVKSTPRAILWRKSAPSSKAPDKFAFCSSESTKQAPCNSALRRSRFGNFMSLKINPAKFARTPPGRFSSQSACNCRTWRKFFCVTAMEWSVSTLSALESVCNVNDRPEGSYRPPGSEYERPISADNKRVNTALKEWASVISVLSTGQQVVLLRKGGIVEAKRGFELLHPEFLLFPAFEHQHAE